MAAARTTPRPPARRRPPRARSAPQRRSGSIRWDRLARTALLVVLGAILLLYVPPLTRWLHQADTAAHQGEEVERLIQENEELEERLSSLRGAEAIEREARRLGMVREGERAYVVEDFVER